MTYLHRNGETEPPTEAGWYWFVGRKRHHPRRVRWAGTIRLWWNAGELRTKVPVWSPCLVDDLVGQWWGPITPPWEQSDAS